MKRSNQFNLTKESIVLFTFGLMFILYSALTDDYYATLHVQAQLSQQQQQEQQNSIVLDVVSAKEEKGGDSLSLNNIFKQVENSVVQITRKVPPPSSISPPGPETENATALGSGFVYDNKGRIITNNHVVGDAKIVDITLVDGNRYTANVIGTDIFSDIAVIEIVGENLTEQSSPPPPPLRPLIIGNSSELEVGEQVIAI